jgi:hypothetical protein
MVRATLMAMLAAMVAAPATLRAQGVPAPPEGFTVTAGADRPAIFVADRLTYTIEIVCPRGYDILTADLGRDRLKLTGLEVIGDETTRRDEGGVTHYRFDYILTTYRVDVATPAIASFPVRYYLTRPGQRPEEAAPAGSLAVPAVALAFRSLLPDDQAIYDVRDERAVPPPWLPLRALELTGIALIVLSIVPAALVLVRAGRALRARREGAPRSSRHARETAHAALEAVRAADVADPADRRAAFARLDALVRQHVAEVCGVPAAGLTPDELQAALEPCAARVPVPQVISILAACELARYASDDLQPSAQAWRDAVEQAGQVIDRGR